MDKNFFCLYCCDRGVYGDVLVMLVRLLPAGTTRQRRCRQTKRRVYIHCGLPPLLILRATHVTTATLSSSSFLAVRSQIHSNYSNAKKRPNNSLLIGSEWPQKKIVYDVQFCPALSSFQPCLFPTFIRSSFAISLICHIHLIYFSSFCPFVFGTPLAPSSIRTLFLLLVSFSLSLSLRPVSLFLFLSFTTCFHTPFFFHLAYVRVLFIGEVSIV